MFKTILFPVDQSRETMEAVAIVSNIVKTYESRLILLSVVEKNTTEDNLEGKRVMADEKVVAELLEKAKALFLQEGVEAKVIEKQGMPSFIICDIADEINADLIIMGSRGLGLTDEGIHDSVTYRVINLSPCPVLVVP